MDQKQAMLARVPLFAGLGSRHLGKIERLCDEVDVRSGFVVTREGAMANEFFVILAGRIGIDRGGQHLRDMGPGDYLGELALLAKAPRSATATALEPTRLLVLARREFNELLAEFPKIRAAVLRTVAERVMSLQPDAPH